MPPIGSELRRNLVAGARLAMGLRVAPTSFRVGAAQLLALIALGIVLDIALDRLVTSNAARWSHLPLQGEALEIAALMATCTIVALALRQPHLMLALPLAVLAAEPLLRVTGVGYQLAATGTWGRVSEGFAWALWSGLMAWSLVVIARALLLMLASRPPGFRLRAMLGALFVFGTGLGVQFAFPHNAWWYPTERTTSRSGADYWSRIADHALERQRPLLDGALARIHAQRPGIVDLYFVGFAPFATEDVFRRDVELGSAVVAERYDGAGRSILLVNHPSTILQSPLATTENLRATLNAIAARIDRDEDVVMLFISSHGSSDHRLAVQFPPLQLTDLTPAGLRAMLDEAGIRWRVVIVSACYSGGFIPALAGDGTLILAAAAADRTSFGCSDDSPLTYFTDALFNQAMRSEPTLAQAFAKARDLVRARERAEGLEPSSEPAISLGSAIAGRLDRLPSLARPGSTTTACTAPECGTPQGGRGTERQ